MASVRLLRDREALAGVLAVLGRCPVWLCNYVCVPYVASVCTAALSGQAPYCYSLYRLPRRESAGSALGSGSLRGTSCIESRVPPARDIKRAPKKRAAVRFPLSVRECMSLKVMRSLRVCCAAARTKCVSSAIAAQTASLPFPS